jgi:hypothetical protein
MIKKAITAFLLVLAYAPISSAQQTKPGAPAGTRVPTATRLVVTFHDLERQLTIAAQKNDQSTLNRLLANEFEVWTPAPPGDPVPRAAWLTHKTPGAPDAFSIRQMAVRALDDHAVASFVLIEGTGARQAAEFIVDVWSRSGGEWKLTDRYTSPVPAALFSGDRKPTGKD